MQFDIAIIGGGPGGSSTAISAARAGLRVVLFEKSPYGRDKVCGDGLTPRAIGALNDLNIDHSVAHRIDGLRMIAGKKQRELLWPATDRFPHHGAVWPRQKFDNHLLDVAIESGADVRFNAEALPVIEDGVVVGVEVNGEVIRASLVVLATGAQGAAAKMLGAVRDPDETFGLAIRAYAPTPRHAERHLEACLSLRDEHGTPVPGYGWMFPAGDGTVNIGVGLLSTFRDYKSVNTTHLLNEFAHTVGERWEIDPDQPTDKPMSGRIPMGGSVGPKSGPTYLVIGDAAGSVNPFNGEGIDYAYETARIATQVLTEAIHNNDPTALQRYQTMIDDEYGQYFKVARLFARIVGRPAIMRELSRVGMNNRTLMEWVLRIMSNLLRPDEIGPAEAAYKAAAAIVRLAPNA